MSNDDIKREIKQAIDMLYDIKSKLGRLEEESKIEFKNIKYTLKDIKDNLKDIKDKINQ